MIIMAIWRRSSAWLLLLQLICSCILLSDVYAIVPAPAVEHFTAESSVLVTIEPSTLRHKIITQGRIIDQHDDRVIHFIEAAMDRFVESSFHLPDFPESFEKNPNQLQLCPLDFIGITVLTDNVEFVHGVDESYSLNVTTTDSGDDSDYRVILEATNVFGVVRGLETFSQLFQFGWLRDGGVVEAEHEGPHPVFVISDAPISIYDEPLYPYRGLLIDTSRHYLPVSLILANLDVMAMNKLNVLHWHIVDSQSFPYLSKIYPELALNGGAYHPRKVYTTLDIQNIIHQAYLRGIRVIPEFDVPGHTQAVAKSHPEVMSVCPDPSEPLDPTKAETYDLVANLYKEVMELFPDQMIHVGGDEVSLECWKNSSSIQDYMKKHDIKTELDLFEYFETKLLHDIIGNQKQTIVWQEVFDLGLLSNMKETIVNVWKGWDNLDVDTLVNATTQGYQVVVSSCWYLDILSKSWYDYYQCNPGNMTSSAGGNPDLIIGGHGSMWGEMVDASNFMSRVWPRASSVAERLWTSTDNNAEQTIHERIHQFRCHMVRRGVPAGPTGPGSCDKDPDFSRTKLAMYG
jgi:hexosaminidase